MKSKKAEGKRLKSAGRVAIPLLLSFILYPLSFLHAASWFVTGTGSGAFSGATWNDAWAHGSINWASVSPGDTVFLGGGGQPWTNRFHIQASGTPSAPVTIKRVVSTDAAAVAAPGWDAGFDAPVVIGASNSYAMDFDGWRAMSNIWVDGRIPMTSLAVAGGIQLCVSDNPGGVAVTFSNQCNNIVFTNVECIGPGSPNTTGYPFVNEERGFELFDTSYGTSGNNVTIANSRIRGMVDAIYLAGNKGVTVDHCQIYDIWALGGAGLHDNVLVAGGGGTTNCTFRYNQVWTAILCRALPKGWT